MFFVWKTDNHFVSMNFIFFLMLVLASAFGESLSDFLSFIINVHYLISMACLLVFVIVVYFLHDEPEQSFSFFWMILISFCLLATAFVDWCALTLKMNIGVVLALTVVLPFMGYTLLYLLKKRLFNLNVSRRNALLLWLELFCLLAIGTALGDFISDTIYNAFLLSVFLFGEILLGLVVLYRQFRIPKMLSVSAAIIFSRSLGVSLSDAIAFPTQSGGMGVGYMYSGLLFLILFLLSVAYYVYHSRRVHSEEIACK